MVTAAPMNTTLNRLNSVSALATTTLLFICGIIAFLSYPLPSHKPSDATSLRLANARVVRGRAQWHMDRRVQDYVEVRFDVDADFSKLFGWNTKQVFVSIAAKYQSQAHRSNEVVFWDRIIQRKEDAHVVLVDEPNKYAFREVSGSFSNISSASYTLKWNVMPKVGALAFGDERSSGEIELPRRDAASGASTTGQGVEKIWY